MRTKSHIIVKVVDLSKNPGVIERLKLEQAADPSLISLDGKRMAIVDGRTGTHLILADGSFYRRPIEERGTEVAMLRYHADKTRELIVATFTGNEIKAAMTGEELSLDEFVQPGDIEDSRLKLIEAHIR